jgi:hypothetical protein
MHKEASGKFVQHQGRGGIIAQRETILLGSCDESVYRVYTYALAIPDAEHS